MRCGAIGHIDDIKSKECPKATADPKYPEEPHGGTKLANPPMILGDNSREAMEQELLALKILEQELAVVNEIQQEMEFLEALEQEQLMLEVNKVTGRDEEVEMECEKYQERSHDLMKEKLINMKFPETIAQWAVETSGGEWSVALDKAYKRIQQEEHEALVKAEEAEEKAKRGATKKRPPASPSTSHKPAPIIAMPPPPHVPEKSEKIGELSIAEICASCALLELFRWT